jgi:Tol biopolymer transport system component
VHPSLRSMLTAAWLERRSLLHAAISPRGRTLAVTTSRVPAGAGAEVIELLLVDLASGAVAMPPAAGPGDHTATWSPDGTRMAFISARTGEPQVVVARPDDAAPRMISSLTGAASGPVGWSPDGSRLVLPVARGRSNDHSAPHRITRAVHWADGIGVLDDPPQLVVIDATTGVAQPLTDDEWRWSLPMWSPDGRTIAARASHDPSGRRRGMHVRLVDATTGQVTEPHVPAGFATVPIWLADGRLVVLSVQPEGRPPRVAVATPPGRPRGRGAPAPRRRPVRARRRCVRRQRLGAVRRLRVGARDRRRRRGAPIVRPAPRRWADGHLAADAPGRVVGRARRPTHRHPRSASQAAN